MPRRRVALPLVALVLALPAASAQSASEPARPESSSDGTAQAAAAPAEPRGVVVHAPAPPAARAREQLRPGVTGGTDPRPATPRIRVLVERSRTIEPLPLPRPELPPVRFGLGPTSAPAGVAPLPPARTIGPGVAEQRRAFDAPPTEAGAVPRPESGWAPLPAYEGDVRVPYPWNPATFDAPPAWSVWSPTPAWPTGPDLPDGDRVRWTPPILDPGWTPSGDAGGDAD